MRKVVYLSEMGERKFLKWFPFSHANQDIHIRTAQVLGEEGKEGEKTRKGNI